MRCESCRKAGPVGHEPVSFGARVHGVEPAPVTRHARRLGVAGSAELRTPSVPAAPHALRRFLAAHAALAYRPPTMPEWEDIRALILETADAA